MRLIRRIIVILSVVMIVLGVFSSISSTIKAESDLVEKVSNTESEELELPANKVDKKEVESINTTEESSENDTTETSFGEEGKSFGKERFLNEQSSQNEQYLSNNELELINEKNFNDELDLSDERDLNEKQLSNNSEVIGKKNDIENEIDIFKSVYSLIDENAHANKNDLIKDFQISKSKVYPYEMFEINILFAIDDAKKLNDKYEFELTDSDIIKIVASNGNNQFIAIEKNGIEYGKAILETNRIILEFNKDRCKNLTDISGSVSFSATVKVNDGFKNIPNEAIVENINVGDKKVSIEILFTNNDSDKNKAEVPFFKSGFMTEEGKLKWGLVFNQNIDNINNFVQMTRPIEVYDDTGEQMEIIKDPELFSLTIHNEEMMVPDYELMQSNGQMEQYNNYYRELLYSGRDVSEIKNYMNVPMKIDESRYPTKIFLKEKNEDGEKYLSIIAHYSEQFSGNYYFSNGDVEVGRIYFRVPDGVLYLNDILKYAVVECNSKGNYFMDKSSMYVILYPGFVEGKFLTLSYMTDVAKGHENDEFFKNKASVSYIDREVELNNARENFQAEAKNIIGKSEFDFKVRKNHLKIYEYGKSIEEGLGGFSFAIYDNYDTAISDNNGDKAIFVVETLKNGFSKEVPLEEGREYFIKQIKVPGEYEIDNKVNHYEMKNKSEDEGNIYYFTNQKINVSTPKILPQTGGAGVENYVVPGFFIQLVFLAVKKIIRLYL